MGEAEELSSISLYKVVVVLQGWVVYIDCETLKKIQFFIHYIIYQLFLACPFRGPIIRKPILYIKGIVTMETGGPASHLVKVMSGVHRYTP